MVEKKSVTLFMSLRWVMCPSGVMVVGVWLCRLRLTMSSMVLTSPVAPVMVVDVAVEMDSSSSANEREMNVMPLMSMVVM